MRKAILALILLPLFGCASILETAAPIIPRLELGAAEKGFGLKIDPANLGVNTFCLRQDGAPAEWLNTAGSKAAVVKVFTDFIKDDVFGTCPTNTPIPEVLE